jgi:hypothetical protein
VPEDVLPRSGLTKDQSDHFNTWSKQATTPADREALGLARINAIRANQGQPEYPTAADWRADAGKNRADRRAARADDQQRRASDPAGEERLQFAAANRARVKAGQAEHPSIEAWRASTTSRPDRRVIAAAAKAAASPAPEPKRTLGQRVGRALRGPPSRGVDLNGNDLPIGKRYGLTERQKDYFDKWKQSAAGNPAELEHMRFVRTTRRGPTRASRRSPTSAPGAGEIIDRVGLPTLALPRAWSTP